jgi:hypothetical protein
LPGVLFPVPVVQADDPPAQPTPEQLKQAKEAFAKVKAVYQRFTSTLSGCL